MPERKVVALNAAHILPLTSAVNIWSVTAAVGVFPDDLLDPSYWKHIANEKLSSEEIIWARCQDGTWWAAYLVLYVGQNSAKMQMLFSGALDEVGDSDVDTHTVKWISPTVQWGVKRVADNETVRGKFETKEQAVAWLNQNIKDFAA